MEIKVLSLFISLYFSLNIIISITINIMKNIANFNLPLTLSENLQFTSQNCEIIILPHFHYDDKIPKKSSNISCNIFQMPFFPSLDVGV